MSPDRLPYPAAPRSAQVDTYGNERVPDPYRPLEDDRSEATARWVAAENEETAKYFAQIPYRPALLQRLTRLQNYPRYSAPIQKGRYLFFRKNDGLQNQDLIYVQEGMQAAPRLLLDPNKLSADGTSRVLLLSPSHTGQYAAFTVSGGGSDWQDVHVLEVGSGKTLPETLHWLKASAIAWAGDGFFYSRYDAPAAGHELASKNEFQKVYFHRVGTEQASDELVYQDLHNPLRFHTVDTTPDESVAVLSISERGKGKDGNALWYRDLSQPGKKFIPIVSDIGDTKYEVITHRKDKLLIQTNAGAANGKLAEYDPAATGERWRDIVPAKAEPLEFVHAASGKLFVGYTKDVTTRVSVYNLDGMQENEINLPGLGTATGFEGDETNQEVFYSFTSMNIARSIYRYDIDAKKSVVFRSADVPGFNPDHYESKQVFYKSKDGTRVPMFLLHKKGLKLDGTNPTLLYAYGGFNIINAPAFVSLRLALLEQGFVYASANLRGGGEYGEAWHRAGMRAKKQNVFDDFIAAAEWLIQNKYTSPGHLAVHGISNGGLLIGTVINQRPDLFRVALAQAGVMDMLRFQKFTIGWNWTADYGSSENASDYPVLRAYSPLHNIRAGVRYPATLITTADHDDRVVPAHSFKYAATLQEKASPERPVLIRIDTNSGHGPSSTRKTLEQTTDLYAFLFDNLGVTPKLD